MPAPARASGSGIAAVYKTSPSPFTNGAGKNAAPDPRAGAGVTKSSHVSLAVPTASLYLLPPPVIPQHAGIQKTPPPKLSVVTGHRLRRDWTLAAPDWTLAFAGVTAVFFTGAGFGVIWAGGFVMIASAQRFGQDGGGSGRKGEAHDFTRRYFYCDCGHGCCGFGTAMESFGQNLHGRQPHARGRNGRALVSSGYRQRR